VTALLVALLVHADGGAAPMPSALEDIWRLAKKAEPRAEAAWVRAFLAAAQQLPSHPPQTFFRTADKKRAYTASHASAAPAAERATLKRIDADDGFYYARIADPLGYWRPFEVLAARGFEPEHKRVLDFGYGSIGQLKMLAALEADVTGIEVDPVLPLLYAGEMQVRVLNGYFPKDAALVAQAGDGYDLWMSKNTLKRGYVNPPDGSHSIDLSGDATFLGQVHRMLKPGGLFFIYNFGPGPASPGKPYIPMADIACPFAKKTIESAGFEVLFYDEDDTAPGRASAKILEWDKVPDAMDVEHDLFARYTLARRK
jgi:SAM-dependent methyltransferase